jgi:hypothetical protein
VDGLPSLSMPTQMKSSSDDGHESNVFTEKRHVAVGQSYAAPYVCPSRSDASFGSPKML